MRCLRLRRCARRPRAHTLLGALAMPPRKRGAASLGTRSRSSAGSLSANMLAGAATSSVLLHCRRFGWGHRCAWRRWCASVCTAPSVSARPAVRRRHADVCDMCRCWGRGSHRLLRPVVFHRDVWSKSVFAVFCGMTPPAAIRIVLCWLRVQVVADVCERMHNEYTPSRITELNPLLTLYEHVDMPQALSDTHAR